MILKITLDLPEDHAYLRMTRELGRTILTSIQAVQSDIDDVDTLISELYANVLRHGTSQEGRFQVSSGVLRRPYGAVCHRPGKGFSFKDVPEPGAVRADFNGGERIGGYGLELVKALADHVEFRRFDSCGTTVRAEKHLHYVSRAAEQEAERLDHSAVEHRRSAGKSKSPAPLVCAVGLAS